MHRLTILNGMVKKLTHNSSKQKASIDYVDSIKQKSTDYITNVKAQLLTLTTSKPITLPVTINEDGYGNSYVCSPYTAFIPYCREECKKLNSYTLQALIKILILILDPILKVLKINRVYQANNWLLSTNLFPRQFNKNDILINKRGAIKKHPKHLIMYRSLNYHTNPSLIKAFLSLNFHLLPSRQVYIFDKSVNDYTQHHNYKLDKKLLAETTYKLVSQDQIMPSDLPRIAELYHLLYIDKYSKHNPMFTEKYFQLILSHPNFKLEAFRNSKGIIDAVGGRFEMDGIVTLPIVGYDTSKPQKLGLYRLVMISTLLYAEKNNLIFNASSGAANFKSLRGAKPFIEYSVIFFEHLSFPRRMLWLFLTRSLKRAFIPIMQKYKL